MIILGFKFNMFLVIVIRNCNRDIKLISVEAILVTLSLLRKWFCMVRKPWKPPSRKSYQNFRNLQRKYLWWSFVIAKSFFAVQSNLTYDSEAYDLMELYLETSHSVSGSNTCSGAFSAEIVNVLEQLVIFTEELYRGCLARFYRGVLDSPHLLVLLIYKNNKMKSWTHPTSSFPWLTPAKKI